VLASRDTILRALRLADVDVLLLSATAQRPARAFHPHGPMEQKHRIFTMAFASVYPHYIAKATRKGRAPADVDAVICWLTGYSAEALAAQIERRVDFETFFAEAPAMHPNASKITGVICNVRIETIADPLMQKIRYMDKLVDEVAKGRAMEKILRP
jgi:hypothetical protein